MSVFNRPVLLLKFAKLRQQNIFDSFHVCFSLHSLIPAPSPQPPLTPVWSQRYAAIWATFSAKSKKKKMVAFGMFLFWALLSELRASRTVQRAHSSRLSSVPAGLIESV